MYQIHVTYFQKTILLRDPPLCFFGGVVWKTLFSRSAFQSRVSAIHVTSQSFDEWFVAAEDLSIFFSFSSQQCCYYLEKHVGVDSLCSTWLLNMGSQSALVEYACTYRFWQEKCTTGIIKYFLEQLHRYFLLQSSNN